MKLILEILSGDYSSKILSDFCSLSCLYRKKTVIMIIIIANIYWIPNMCSLISKDFLSIISIYTKNDISNCQFTEGKTEA